MTNTERIQANNAELREAIEMAESLPEAGSGGNIPEWALQPEKPSYSKEEVGLANVDNVKQYSESNPPPYPVTSVNGQTGDVTVTVPSKTSELENDSGFIKSNEAPVQSVNGKAGVVTLAAGDVGARPSTWTPTYSEVGADKSGTASSAVSSHNTNTDAHNDIRLLIAGLTEKLNALANSTDDDLDQMAEIVAYIKSNKTLIDSITTSKVSVADVVNNLTSNVANKPLSAAQGVVLKALIDAITVPTKVSQLTNDKGYLTSYTETDPTVPSWAKQSSKPRYNANEVGAVAYTAQSLTEEQKAQARENIGIVGTGKDGKDYVLTEADKVEISEIVIDESKGDIVQSIIAELQGLPVFGVVDENKKIKLTTLLPDGTYVMGYENEDGTFTKIADFVVDTESDEPTYVNLIPTAKTPTDTSTIFNNGLGYMDGKYASSSSPYYGDDGATFVTGLIEATPTSVFYIKGVTINTSNSHNRLGAFSASGVPDAVKPFTQMTDYATLETLGTQYYKLTMNATYINANFAKFKYIMFSAMGSGANCIIATTPIEE